MMPDTYRVEKMEYGGDGLAHLEGGAGVAEKKIPFVLPGELVKLSGAGELSVLEASPDRVAPECIHFGACGGCQYQHAAYSAQVRIKKAILEDAFAAEEVPDVPAITTHSAQPWQYRNRIRLRVGEVEGELRVGYNRFGAMGGDALLPIMMCPIAAPVLWQAAATLIELAKKDAAVGGWLDAAVELELFTNADESAVQLTLFTRKPPLMSFAAFGAEAQRAIPQLTGAGVALLPKKPLPQGRRFESSKPGPHWGSTGLLHSVDEYSYWVGRGAFFQVNRHLVSTLAELATGNRSGNVAWDLYAGVGLFSRALTKGFGQVTGVEPGEAAFAGLAAALKASHRAVQMMTLDFLQAAVVQRERPELIVMDPPRAGVGAEACALLARVRAAEVVYVSCDPMTLARDVKQLTGAGYRIAEVHLVDMFPQTFHMETVAVLHR